MDLGEFTARLHQIAGTQPTWLPKIRGVVADTLATSTDVLIRPPTSTPEEGQVEMPNYVDHIAMQVSQPCQLPPIEVCLVRFETPRTRFTLAATLRAYTRNLPQPRLDSAR